MNEAGSKAEKSMSIRGGGVAPLKEGHTQTRERWPLQKTTSTPTSERARAVLRFVELTGVLEFVVDDLSRLVKECDPRPARGNLQLRLHQLDLLVGVEAPRIVRSAHQLLQALIEHRVLRLLDCRVEP